MTVVLSIGLWAQNSRRLPPISELPEVEGLPDPFKFFGSNKRVGFGEFHSPEVRSATPCG